MMFAACWSSLPSDSKDTSRQIEIQTRNIQQRSIAVGNNTTSQKVVAGSLPSAPWRTYIEAIFHWHAPGCCHLLWHECDFLPCTFQRIHFLSRRLLQEIQRSFPQKSAPDVSYVSWFLWRKVLSKASQRHSLVGLVLPLDLLVSN